MTAPSTSDPATSLSLLLAELDAGERGYVLGRLATAGAAGDLTEALLAGAAGQRCGQLLGQVAALPRPERLRLMDTLARDALGPIPGGAEHVHPDALRPLLEAESSAVLHLFTGDDVPAVLRATAAGLLAERRGEAAPDIPPGEEAAQEVRRAVLAPVVPVPAWPSAARAPQRVGLMLAALDGESLLSEVTAAGARLLGTSLQGSAPSRVEQTAAPAGPPWTEQIRAAAATEAVPRAHERAPWTRRRARELVAATGTAGPPLEMLRRLGAVALGVQLRANDPALIAAVAQRLPGDLAQRLRATAGD